jgi:hypothetical protein
MVSLFLGDFNLVIRVGSVRVFDIPNNKRRSIGFIQPGSSIFITDIIKMKEIY